MFEEPIPASGCWHWMKEYELNSNDLLISDQERALAIAGVMGGEQSGVTATTTDMLLEAAYFDPRFIRRTSRRLGLISESSFRFERGIDPEVVLLASVRATELLAEVAGGKADESAVIGGSIPHLRHLVEMRPERCTKLLGMEVPDSAGLLVRLGLRNLGGNLLKSGKRSSCGVWEQRAPPKSREHRRYRESR